MRHGAVERAENDQSPDLIDAIGHVQRIQSDYNDEWKRRHESLSAQVNIVGQGITNLTNMLGTVGQALQGGFQTSGSALAPENPPVRQNIPPSPTAIAQTTTADGPTTSRSSGTNGAEITYYLNRTVASVTELWLEWKSGLRGGPAVSDLVNEHQLRWLANENERRFFNRRRHIIRTIVSRIANKTAEETEDSIIMEYQARLGTGTKRLQKLNDELMHESRSN